MESTRIFRILEGSLIALFFVQAGRVVLGMLIKLVNLAMLSGQVSFTTINAHLVLVVAILLCWFAPRSRKRLPTTLSVSAIIVAIARVVMSVQVAEIRLYAGIVIVGFSSVYFVSLMRANWKSWATIIVSGLVIDQLFRAYNTYDLSIRIWHQITIGDLIYWFPWLTIQIALSIVLIVFSRFARRNARQEPFAPAYLNVWGGIALGSFLALQMTVLSYPSVVSRWAGVSYIGIVPWILLATALPLLPGVRKTAGVLITIFDERLRGWVWLFLFLLAFVVGNRLGGYPAASAMIIAQFMAILLLWWIPSSPQTDKLEQVGPSHSLGLLVFVLLIYLYSFTFVTLTNFSFVTGQSLLTILVAAALLGLPRLLWREADPWLLPLPAGRAFPLAFIMSVTVAGYLISSVEIKTLPTNSDTLQVATYNINGGYDSSGAFQLDLIAATIETSNADIIVLQEVDAGRPVSFGIDQVQFLASRLNMYQIYQPVVEQVHGIALLSRLPIIDQAGVMLPGVGGNSAALRGTVVEPATGRTIVVAGTQLVPAQPDQRLRQLAVLFDLIGETTPVIMAADLGADPGEVVYQQIIGTGYLDPDALLGIERGFTVPAENPFVRHDYVLLQDLSPLASRHVNSLASDHRLVVVDIDWR